MLGTLLVTLALLQAPAGADRQSSPQPAQAAAAPSEPSAVPDKAQALLKVRRIYVDSFGTSEAAQGMQAMLITAFTESKRFTVTEDKARADAILKGTGSEKTSQEVHAYGSGTAVATAGAHVSEDSGFAHRAAGAISDSSVNTETIDYAKASVRLVNSEGDVIWTSTQESKGAKYKGASADVAEKIVKQLLRDIDKAEKPPVSPPPKN